MSRLLHEVTNSLVGKPVKEVEAAVCHVQTRYRPLRKVMSFQGPSCDALTGKHMLINVPEGFFLSSSLLSKCPLPKYLEWCRSVGVLAIAGTLKLGMVLVILIVLVLALFDFRCLILL